MPNRLKTVCRHPGCKKPARGGYCDSHKRPATYDRRRGSASARGYNHDWHKARTAYLRENPLCVECLPDKVVPANVVDHIVDHKGDMELFWDVDNWQSLCTQCHNRKTATTNRATA